MSIESIFPITLILATFLTSLVAGFLLAFAIVVMPGIRALPDRQFIRAFQVMDRIIQNNHPLFVVVWAGSVVTTIVAALFGLWHLDDIARVALLLATFVYLVGVQLPTITINVPLNNRLQTFDTSAADTTMQKQARTEFESRWNRWNALRTLLATLVSITFMLLL